MDLGGVGWGVPHAWEPLEKHRVRDGESWVVQETHAAEPPPGLPSH